jgi:amidohydrolase
MKGSKLIMELEKLIEEIKPYVVEMRHYFHAHPEKSWNEYKTAERIEEELGKMGIPFERVCKTGVIGTISGKHSSGKRLGIRADIDALEIEEETSLDFKSHNKGVMHACGHDAHIAMLLGTAKVLKSMEDDLKCTVKLIFQPAEEFIQDSGAKYMSELDDIKKLDHIITMHIWSDLEAGTASIVEGPRMASADTFDIFINGKGGHGAMPNSTIDPIVISSEFVNKLQTIVSREINPLDTAVISICSFQSGNSANVIPSSAHLQGTARTFNNKLREEFPERIERILAGTCEAMRGTYELQYHMGTPATINNAFSAEIGRKAAKEVFGESGLVDYAPQMGGEDFAKYLVQIPGSLLFLGGGNIKQNKKQPHHSSKFDIDEKALPLGVEYFVRFALEIQDKM